jgi:hypothetical protein
MRRVRSIAFLTICGSGLLVVSPVPSVDGMSRRPMPHDLEGVSYPVPEQLERIIDRLRSRELNQEMLDDNRAAYEEAQHLIGRLGSFAGNPVAIRELIRCLDFAPPPWHLLLPAESSLQDRRAFEQHSRATPVVSEPRMRHPIRDYPAVRALLRMGPVVAQYLVDDYVKTYLDCTDLRVRRMHPRLNRLVMILTYDHRLAPPAVVYALKRLADEKDATARQAYQTLIDEVVAEFPESKRAELFPPEALRK